MRQCESSSHKLKSLSDGARNVQRPRWAQEQVSANGGICTKGVEPTLCGSNIKRGIDVLEISHAEHSWWFVYCGGGVCCPRNRRDALDGTLEIPEPER